MKTIWKESYVLTKVPFIHCVNNLALLGIGMIAVGLLMMLSAGFLLFQYNSWSIFFAVVLFSLSLWLLKTGQFFTPKKNKKYQGLWKICADDQSLSLIFWDLNLMGQKTEQRFDIRGIRYIEFPQHASRLLHAMPIDFCIKTSSGAFSFVLNPGNRSGFNKLLKYLRQHHHIHFYAI